ncbi:hypothetical protein [Acidovorax soli]|uniref:hypothetical protein n=1 Tax=Acidovorax soli TaxID=592050 RepID=UPI0032B29B25
MSAPIFWMPSGREVRRYEKRVAKRPKKDAFDRNRHEVINPVTEAVIRSRIEADIQQLRTDTGLQAYIGDDAARVANMAGRLVYIVCHAAGLHGLGETPEARILAGTANALADIAETPAELDRQRGAVIAGLAAIDRLMPKLHTFSLAAGSLELDHLLHSANGMGTADVRRALGMRA